MNHKTFVVEHDGRSVTLPCFELIGSTDGPTGFVSSGMHGNEVNGIAITRRFLERMTAPDLAGFAGRLLVLPLLNPSGFARMERRVAEDDQDLNRSFGFDEPTTLSQAMAATLSTEVFQHCQFGVDLHDAGGRAVLLPHSRVHSSDGAHCHHNTKQMGQVFGTKLVLQRPGRPQMLAVNLNDRFRIPVLTVEIGGAQRLAYDYQAQAIEGLLNVMTAFDMLEREIPDPGQQYFLHDRYGARVSEACLVQFSAKLGDQVHAGDALGDLYFPARNETEIIRSPMCGLLFSIWDRHQAPDGARLYSILEENECHVERTTLDMFEPLPELRIRRIAM